MWWVGSTAQAQLTAKKLNKRQNGKDRRIFNLFALVTKFAH
jgi:hypothetical protein